MLIYNGYHFIIIHQICYTRHGASATKMRGHGLCPKKMQSSVENAVTWKGTEFA